jgi:hypothetical protein
MTTDERRGNIDRIPLLDPTLLAYLTQAKLETAVEVVAARLRTPFPMILGAALNPDGPALLALAVLEELRPSIWSVAATPPTVAQLLIAGRDTGTLVSIADLARATTLVDLLRHGMGGSDQVIAMKALGGRPVGVVGDAILVEAVPGLPDDTRVTVYHGGAVRIA